jgi:hypothetical protein
MRVTNDIPLGCSLPLSVGNVNSAHKLKAEGEATFSNNHQLLPLH